MYEDQDKRYKDEQEALDQEFEELVREQQEKEDIKTQEKNASTQSMNQVHQYARQLSNSADNCTVRLKAFQVVSNEMKVFKEQNKQFFDAGAFDTISYFTTAFMVLVVIGVNYFLINAPVTELASLAFEYNDWRAGVATVLLPIGLMIIELYISAQIYVAQGKLNAFISRNRQKGLITKVPEFKLRKLKIKNKIHKWQVVGYFMVAFTPLMILGTALMEAILSENRFNAANIITHLGLIILAGVTDASIVFSGELLCLAKAFILFKLSYPFLLRKKHFRESKYKESIRDLTNYYNLYSQSLRSHREAYPQDSQVSYRFSLDVILTVNKYLNKDALPL